MSASRERAVLAWGRGLGGGGLHFQRGKMAGWLGLWALELGRLSVKPACALRGVLLNHSVPQFPLYEKGVR